MGDCTEQKIQNPEPEKEKELFKIQDYSLEASEMVGNHFSKLSLDNTTNFKSSSIPIRNSNSNSKIPMKTLKRRSPSDSPPISQDSQPNPKKEKLSLPPPFLRRCISDPFSLTPPPLTPPPLSTNKASAAASASRLSTNNTNIKASKPALFRSVSDPNTSPSPAALKTMSRASSGSTSGDDDATPNSLRLRRMKNRISKMSLWFQQVMLDDQDHNDEDEKQQHHQQNGATPTSSTKDDDDCDKKFEESVSVEKIEEGLVVHFRCHCGVPYQFLLAGGNCYYKLM